MYTRSFVGFRFWKQLFVIHPYCLIWKHAELKTFCYRNGNVVKGILNAHTLQEEPQMSSPWPHVDTSSWSQHSRHDRSQSYIGKMRLYSGMHNAIAMLLRFSEWLSPVYTRSFVGFRFWKQLLVPHPYCLIWKHAELKTFCYRNGNVVKGILNAHTFQEEPQMSSPWPHVDTSPWSQHSRHDRSQSYIGKMRLYSGMHNDITMLLRFSEWLSPVYTRSFVGFRFWKQLFVPHPYCLIWKHVELKTFCYRNGNVVKGILNAHTLQEEPQMSSPWPHVDTSSWSQHSRHDRSQSYIGKMRLYSGMHNDFLMLLRFF